jgi:hypothetical protein
MNVEMRAVRASYRSDGKGRTCQRRYPGRKSEYGRAKPRMSAFSVHKTAHLSCSDILPVLRSWCCHVGMWDAGGFASRLVPVPVSVDHHARANRV